MLGEMANNHLASQCLSGVYVKKIYAKDGSAGGENRPIQFEVFFPQRSVIHSYLLLFGEEGQAKLYIPEPLFGNDIIRLVMVFAVHFIELRDTGYETIISFACAGHPDQPVHFRVFKKAIEAGN
jgi:hypothetical protein